MARTETAAPTEVVTETPAKPSTETAAPIYLTEHLVLKVPNVTEIAYYKGTELVRATVKNPCPLQPGVAYSLAEIEATHGS